MATTTQNMDIGFFQVGDTFCVEYTLTHNDVNQNGRVATNVEVRIEAPTPQLSFVPGGAAVEQGSFDEVTGVWTVGSILPCYQAKATFCFQVDVDCPHPFEILFDVQSDNCDCELSPSFDMLVVDGVSCCDFASCGGNNTNIYTANGEQSDPVRQWNVSNNEVNVINIDSFTFTTITGGVFQIYSNSANLWSTAASGQSIDIVAGGNISMVSSVSLDFDGNGTYRFLSAPPIDQDQLFALMRDEITGDIRRIQISHGAYADDTAAGADSVPVGGHYFNTTTGVMHTRMS